jgi:hypothetical protein
MPIQQVSRKVGAPPEALTVSKLATEKQGEGTSEGENDE